MEQSSYVDVTLDIVRRLREAVPSVGVCLQAYLMRTSEDLKDITRRGIGVRLVKGAYKEPINVAYPVKSRRGRELLRAGAVDAGHRVARRRIARRSSAPTTSR